MPAVKDLTYAEWFIVYFLFMGLIPSLRSDGNDCPEEEEITLDDESNPTQKCRFYFDEPELVFFLTTMILLIFPILVMISLII